MGLCHILTTEFSCLKMMAIGQGVRSKYRSLASGPQAFSLCVDPGPIPSRTA